MRYSEIITELTLPRTRDKAETILVRAGYEHLGSGSYGSVYQKPGTRYVLKLFDWEDEAYLAFIQLAKENPNPHFPKFFGKPVTIVNGYFVAIRTEPLTEFTSMAQANIIHDYIIKKRDNMLYIHNSWWKPEYEYIQSQPELQIACDLIAKLLLENKRFYCDVHKKNIMMRGSEMVLTDPVATG